MEQYMTSCRAETVELGRKLASRLTPGTLIAFTGGLGAGKTAMCQGIAEGLGCTDPVSSPTFAIVNYYRGRSLLPILICTASTPRPTLPPPGSMTTWTWEPWSRWNGAKTVPTSLSGNTP